MNIRQPFAPKMDPFKFQKLFNKNKKLFYKFINISSLFSAKLVK